MNPTITVFGYRIPRNLPKAPQTPYTLNMDPTEEVLSRGVEKIYPSKKDLNNVLQSEKKITLYNGIDPTGDSLHLGHVVQLQKLRQFQKLGHKVILLIGDFTARIGDPTERFSSRSPLTRDQVLENAKNYKQQAANILDFSGKNPAEIKYNSSWLRDMNLEKIIELMSHITYQQLIERDMFKKRIENDNPIFMHELIYPLLQGYDSVAMNIDLEVGGSDQTFNMLIGRKLVKEYLNKEKIVLTTQLLTVGDGKKIGQSEGNAINLNDNPKTMHGKIMNLPDETIIPLFESCTTIPLEKLDALKHNLKERTVNPLNAKKQLARTIVQQFHGKQAAEESEKSFERIIQRGEAPKQIPTLFLPEKQLTVLDLVDKTSATESRSQAKRLIRQGGIEIDGKKVTDTQKKIRVRDGLVVKVGKRNYFKLKNENF